ncbi:MAG: hypothetical protein AAFQ18_06500 [Pseudomonadota bacterium]
MARLSLALRLIHWFYTAIATGGTPYAPAGGILRGSPPLPNRCGDAYAIGRGETTVQELAC